jgi:hypothetical protein
MEKYGPLGYLVLYASNLAAAVWAIRTAALGKALWEPKVRDFPRPPVRIAGIIAIILVAIIFAVSRKDNNIYVWIPGSIGCGTALSISFLGDVFLRTLLIVRCNPNETGIFAGIWVTKRARAILKGLPEAYQMRDLDPGPPPQAPPASAKALYCSFAAPRIPSRVWPDASISTATASVVGNYILWNAAATVAVALASTLVAIAVS